jgi:uncharacterized damage-inducible protein DinB
MATPIELSPRDARAIYAYNRAVFERFVRKVRRLPRGRATRKRGIGHESLFRTLVHILNVHEVWLVYILQGRTSDGELEPLFADPSRKPTDWKGFDVYSKKVWAGVENALRRETSKSLGRLVKVFWMPGTYSARDGILQATFEQAHHLGEIIGALWQDDTAPPEMTWIDTRREAGRRPRRS